MRWSNSSRSCSFRSLDQTKYKFSNLDHLRKKMRIHFDKQIDMKTAGPTNKLKLGRCNWCPRTCNRTLKQLGRMPLQDVRGRRGAINGVCTGYNLASYQLCRPPIITKYIISYNNHTCLSCFHLSSISTFCRVCYQVR